MPLTHAILCASAANVRDSLRLTSEGRCLSVMPLFHIHGIVATLLASVAAGASVVCTPGFLVPSFFDWLDGFDPRFVMKLGTVYRQDPE